MDKIDLKKVLVEILDDLKKVTLIALEQSGVKKNSDLSKSVRYVTVKEGIQMEVAYYYPYVSGGRKRGIKKVPINALIEYIKKNGITPRPGQTINQLAYAIQTSIYKEGINPKNFIDKVTNVAGAVAQEEIANGLMIEIADELESMFKI